MFSWLIATLVWMVLAGSVCLLKRNNGLVDIFWGLGFVILSGVSFAVSPVHSLNSWALTLLVWLWGLRLSIYLFSRNWNKPEDFRYANWRKDWGKQWVLFSILKVYLLQGLMMQLIAVPILITNVIPRNLLPSQSEEVSFSLCVGILISFLGIAVETIADFQKSRFKKTAKSPTEICQVGLWSISRHPNYLGEILTWIGFGLIPLSLEWGALALFSPFFMIFLLYKVSGIPFLEERMKGRADFEEYKRTTGAIFPKLIRSAK